MTKSVQKCQSAPAKGKEPNKRTQNILPVGSNKKAKANTSVPASKKGKRQASSDEDEDDEQGLESDTEEESEQESPTSDDGEEEGDESASENKDEDGDGDGDEDEDTKGQKLPQRARIALSSNTKETPTHESNEFTIFAGNLSYDTAEDELKGAFEICGTIRSIRMPFDKGTKKSKGFAYIDFSNQKDYGKALSMNGFSLGGRRVKVDAASTEKEFYNKTNTDPTPILFVGNLSFNSTEKTVESAFLKFGQILSVRIPTGPNRASKGYAYVQFKSVDGAKAAMAAPRFELDGRIVRLDYDSGSVRK